MIGNVAIAKELETNLARADRQGEAFAVAMLLSGLARTGYVGELNRPWIRFAATAPLCCGILKTAAAAGLPTCVGSFLSIEAIDAILRVRTLTGLNRGACRNSFAKWELLL